MIDYVSSSTTDRRGSLARSIGVLKYVLSRVGADVSSARKVPGSLITYHNKEPLNVTKKICDRCEKDVTNLPSPEVLKGKSLLGVVQWEFVGRSDMDICIYCVIDAFKSLDDRPQVESRL